MNYEKGIKVKRFRIVFNELDIFGKHNEITCNKESIIRMVGGFIECSGIEGTVSHLYNQNSISEIVFEQ